MKVADSENVLAVYDVSLRCELNALAIGVFRALGSRDYGRIDMRLDGNGHPSFIEANLMPGLSDHGYLARCFDLNEGISYNSMILNIVELAIVRQQPDPEVAAFGMLDDIIPIVHGNTMPVA